MPRTKPLKRDVDPFGRALYDRYRGQDASTVIERDDGHVGVDETGRSYFAQYADWPGHQQRALRFARGRVLDIGCGAGRVALYLQRRGCDVLGIDVSPLALRVCRLRGVRRLRRMSLTQLSRRLGVFDTLILYGNNFGLLANPRRARWLLRRWRRMTSPAARIIAETLDPYKTKVPAHRAYQAWNRRRGRMSGQLRIRVRYACAATPYFDYLFVSKGELRAILKGTGWRVERSVDSKGPLYAAVLVKDGSAGAARGVLGAARRPRGNRFLPTGRSTATASAAPDGRPALYQPVPRVRPPSAHCPDRAAYRSGTR